MESWLLGLDLRTDCGGPVRFARWLCRGRQCVRAIHVAETSMALPQFRGPLTAAIMQRLDSAARLVLADSSASACVDDLEIVAAETADQALIEQASPFEGVVIGRRKNLERLAIVRLGRVARRMLRALPRPVIVVPPGLAADEIGAGPVIVGTDLTDASSAAFDFALRIARDHGRGIVLVHVAPWIEPIGNIEIEDESWPTIVQTYHRDHELRARNWLPSQPADVRLRVEQGDPIERLLAIAAGEDAPLLVVGSRRLGTRERVFTSSVGSHLAAHADRPVAIVPPRE